MRWRWTPWDGLDRDEVHDLFRLRQDVFVVEQECAYADIDGRDRSAFHLLGWKDGVLVACVRAFAAGVLRDEQVIGRVVVHGEHRRRGVASAAMHRAHEQLDPGLPIFLSAQAHLRGFYESLGYAVCGPGYDEDGIPHLPMLRPAQNQAS